MLCDWSASSGFVCAVVQRTGGLVNHAAFLIRHTKQEVHAICGSGVSRYLGWCYHVPDALCACAPMFVTLFVVVVCVCFVSTIVLVALSSVPPA